MEVDLVRLACDGEGWGLNGELGEDFGGDVEREGTGAVEDDARDVEVSGDGGRPGEE